MESVPDPKIKKKQLVGKCLLNAVVVLIAVICVRSRLIEPRLTSNLPQKCVKPTAKRAHGEFSRSVPLRFLDLVQISIMSNLITIDSTSRKCVHCGVFLYGGV